MPHDNAKPLTIGIIGHVGTHNLGDEALIATTIQQVRRRFPDAVILAYTVYPGDTGPRHGIQAHPIEYLPGNAAHSAPPEVAVVPSQTPGEPAATGQASAPAGLEHELRTFLKRVPIVAPTLRGLRDAATGLRAAWNELIFLRSAYRNLAGVDLLLVAGSNQLSDYAGGPWRFPFNLYKWSWLARRRGARVAFLSVGAGPLETRLGRFFARGALRRATYRTFRDESSLGIVNGLGVPGKHGLAPDLAHALRFARPTSPQGGTTPPWQLGINPLPYFRPGLWPESNAEIHGAYLDKLASFALGVLKGGHSVALIPTQLRADPPVIEDLRRRIMDRVPASAGERLSVPSPRSFAELASAIAGTDVMVVTRFHGVVFSAMLGRPLLALSYRHSTADLMADLKQAEYCVDIASFEAADLTQRFERLTERLAAVEDQIRERSEVYRRALEAQFDQVLTGLVGSAADRGQQG